MLAIHGKTHTHASYFFSFLLLYQITQESNSAFVLNVKIQLQKTANMLQKNTEDTEMKHISEVKLKR